METDQWNRTYFQKRTLLIRTIIYDQGGKNIHTEGTSFINALWTTGSYMRESNESGLIISILYKTNSKWTKDLNVGPESIKLEESIGIEFHISLRDALLNLIPQSRGNKSKSKTNGITPGKSFCMVLLLQQNKGHLLNGRRYLQSVCLIRG